MDRKACHRPRPYPSTCAQERIKSRCREGHLSQLYSERSAAVTTVSRCRYQIHHFHVYNYERYVFTVQTDRLRLREVRWSYGLASEKSRMIADGALCPVDEGPGSDDCGSADSYRLGNDEKALKLESNCPTSSCSHLALPSSRLLRFMTYTDLHQKSWQHQRTTNVQYHSQRVIWGATYTVYLIPVFRWHPPLPRCCRV